MRMYGFLVRAYIAKNEDHAGIGFIIAVKQSPVSTQLHLDHEISVQIDYYLEVLNASPREHPVPMLDFQVGH